MELHADFTQRVLLHAEELDWQASPMAGVDRRMLERIGDEVARATTIVRYAPGSTFSPHTHDGGEEFIVLDGVFQDEHGDYPAGSYIRNPPTSRHKPGSESGCVIFVKLWQFDPKDRTHIKIHMNKIGPVPSDNRPGVRITPLFEDTRETVQLETWAPNTAVSLNLPKGAEFLVLDGSLSEGKDRLRKQSWLRMPAGSHFNAGAGRSGVKLWVKYGHLIYAEAPHVNGV